MTPVVPFDPARTTAGQMRVSLQDAYAEAAIVSFVEKLRQLAAVCPDRCGDGLRALDQMLAGMLDGVISTDQAERANSERILMKLQTLTPSLRRALEGALERQIEIFLTLMRKIDGA